MRLSRVFALGAVLSLGALAGSALGEPQTGVSAISNDQKAEARWRFDRGLHLYDTGDFDGARIEFERAFELTHHPVVRLNLGLVYAKLGESLLAVEVLEPLVKEETAQLDAERAAHAQRIYREHSERVGVLQITTNVSEAIIRVDNVDVARAPAPPVQVRAGEHVITVVAAGYEPRRIPVAVPGKAKKDVSIDLIPLEKQYSQLKLDTSVPEVDVYAAGELVGTTPFVSTIAFKPGVHDLLFRRPGYRDEKRTIALHPGSTGELDVVMQRNDDAAALGKLALSVDQPQAVVWVDGQPRTDFASGMTLPLGLHHLRIERAGFYELEREVRVVPEGSRIDIQLFPTSGYMADYVDSARTQRLWGYATLGAGALIAGAGAGFLVYNAGKVDDAERAFDDFEADVIANEPGGVCADQCEEKLDSLVADVDSARDRNVYGWVALGVGAAALTTGTVLLLTGDDPNKYDPDLEGELLGSLGLSFTLGGAQLSGTF